MPIFSKHEQAIEIGINICLDEETEVTPAGVQAWPEYDLYEWLQIGWGMEWDGERWAEVDDEE